MGEVYLAHDLALDRDVALKLLPAAKAEDHAARRRLVHEAQAIAQLDHPYICQVFEIGEAPDGRAYIAMSYVEGQTLAARLADGPLPLRDVLGLGRDIAEALAAAHARGIVHCDVKPQNIMVTPSGRPKLLDFGVATLAAGAARAASAATTSGATARGMVVGTPAYMSPEQVEGRAVDGRADLFSLGAVLFECLVGRRAFDAPSPMAASAAVLRYDPPLVSTLRPDTPADVDELCLRLLAKDPEDRFQTAAEVVGALRLLLPLTHLTPGPEPAPVPSPPAVRWNLRVALRAGVVTAVVAGVAGWVYDSRRQLPQPTAEAERWYRRGTDFIREGAYHSASTALDQAIRVFPEYPLAYARRAEALAELDDQQHASEQLLRMHDVLGDESRLPDLDRLRLQGIRALVLRDLSQAVDSYRALVQRTPADAGAWVDLGRAQEAAEQRVDARASYMRALAIDAGLAAAHVRTASIDAQAGRVEPGLQAFAEAERLYRAGSNVEGETEVLLRRGIFHDARGALADARRDLERARTLASGSGSTAQFIRARLAMGSLMVTAGKYAEAEPVLRDAITDARAAELWALVADGLIEMGAMLVNDPARQQEADTQVQEAVRLAVQRGAQRTAARGTLQRAALALQRDQPALARDLATSTLAFLQPRGYRRLELTALNIVSRAHRDLDDLDRANAAANDVLHAAREIKDDAQIALALSTVAGPAAARGDLPAALRARTEAETLNRRIGDESALAFSLANRAELLIRLGRVAEAEPLLAALDTGIAAGLESYKGRTPRLSYLRALAAAVQGRPADTARHARAALTLATPPDPTAVLAGALLTYAQAGRAVPASARPPVTTAAADQPDLNRELHYWTALDAHARGDDRRALALAADGVALAQKVANDELTWRLAAVGVMAAGSVGDHDAALRMRDAATAARQRLIEKWQTDLTQYDSRADLTALRREMERNSSHAQGAKR